MKLNQDYFHSFYDENHRGKSMHSNSKEVSGKQPGSQSLRFQQIRPMNGITRRKLKANEESFRLR